MDVKKDRAYRNRAIAAAVPLVIILIPLAGSLVGFVVGDAPTADATFLELPDGYDSCVRDTEYMRYHHWELLRQVREEYVREGIRGEINLNRCRECHPNRERFCNECHRAVSLEPDCFGCHYYPAQPEAAHTAGKARGSWIDENS